MLLALRYNTEQIMIGSLDWRPSFNYATRVNLKTPDVLWLPDDGIILNIGSWRYLCKSLKWGSGPWESEPRILKNFKKTLWPLLIDGFELFQELLRDCLILPISPQKFLVLIWSTLEGWKSTWELPSGFEHRTNGLGILRLNQGRVKNTRLWICNLV